MSKLIIVRHGLTDWNKEGRWHGISDISINEEGRRESVEAAKTITNFAIDLVFTSGLKRTQETFLEMNTVLRLSCPVIHDARLNERDYGIFTGKNKWEVKKELGAKKFFQIRRGWDYPIPGGETLKDVSSRVVPFYETTVLPQLRIGKNVLLVSSGNTLRSLLKYLENIPEEEVPNIELAFDQIYVFTVNSEGQILSKEIRYHGYLPQASWFHKDHT